MAVETAPDWAAPVAESDSMGEEDSPRFASYQGRVAIMSWNPGHGCRNLKEVLDTVGTLQRLGTVPSGRSSVWVLCLAIGRSSG